MRLEYTSVACPPCLIGPFLGGGGRRERGALYNILMNAYDVALRDIHTAKKVTLCSRAVSPLLPAKNHGYFLQDRALNTEVLHGV